MQAAGNTGGAGGGDPPAAGGTVPEAAPSAPPVIPAPPAFPPWLGPWLTRLRGFAGQVAIIVIGVLIALGFDELADDAHGRANMAMARNAIRVELGKIVGQGVARQRVAGCIERRLDSLARVLDRAERSGRLPPVGAIAGAPIVAWPRGVWEAGIADETRARFDRMELAAIAGAFEFVPVLRAYNQREFELWSHLAVMVGPGRAIDTAERAGLRADLIEARAINRSMVAVSRSLRQLAEVRGTAYDPAIARHYAGRVSAASAICRPISAVVPPIYGLGS